MTVAEPYLMLWFPDLQLDREGTNATEWVVEGVLENSDSMGPTVTADTTLIS